MSAVRNAGAPGAGPASLVVALPAPYLLFLGDVTEAGYAKTALAFATGRASSASASSQARGGRSRRGFRGSRRARRTRKARARSIIGVANTGGVLKPSWIPSLVEALEAGLDVVSGMHGRLAASRELKAAADRLGRRLIDIRQPPANIPVGTGRKRTGKRLLAVGTDCALGKKYTALAIARAMRQRGVAADFRATGQTGIMIAGSGMPMDAVVSDFVAGAAEILSPDAAPDHWDVIEGQGSLFHPAYAGVSLGLLHGSQPDVIVLCHEPGRDHLLGYPDFPTPSLQDAIALHLKMGSLTNPKIRCAGVSFNTATLSAAEAEAAMKRASDAIGLPVADPIRGGPAFERLVEACLA